MKKVIITTTLFTILMTSYNAFAISEAYRKQLDASGCTQVSEASGACNFHHSKSQNQSEANKNSGTALSGPAVETARELDKKISGKYLGQAVDAMTADGWSRSNQEGTRWKKAGFVAAFKQSNDGKITGVTVK
ncbi:hypothetical protein LPW36_03765 [Jinshanibacter sp. LJY008]|uniref:Uncharacterized protein n=1 Tax=Limnobaculum eriocheiris TaxID=2897391 RepID=A0A9X1SJR5_9GAMM|nr:hypothetical protein [Limnobaculum eriocheiris]MCD1125151.1 hypothetical protein [Limnobaculum eriocheiris]